MLPLDEPEFERWRAAADTAFKSAQAQKDAAIFGRACFMCEQSAQLALKGLLHAVGRGEKTHDLRKLWAALSGAGIDPPLQLDDAVTRLSRHYVMPRYPDVVPGGEPVAFYRKADADEAIADAESVIGAVDALWSARRA